MVHVVLTLYLRFTTKLLASSDWQLKHFTFNCVCCGKMYAFYFTYFFVIDMADALKKRPTIYGCRKLILTYYLTPILASLKSLLGTYVAIIIPLWNKKQIILVFAESMSECIPLKYCTITSVIKII